MKKIVMYFFMAILLITLSGCGPKEYLVDFMLVDEENDVYELVHQDHIGEGNLIEEPDEAVLIGYSFVGWFTDNTYTTAFDFNTVITEDTVLFAKMSINQYAVHYYHVVDGERLLIDEMAFDYDTTISMYDPEMEGYTFEGWYTSSSLDDEYVFGAMPANDIHLFGKFSINQYTITYYMVDSDYEEVLLEVEYDYNDSLDEFIINSGELMINVWYTSNELDEIYLNGTMPANDITLYGEWVINEDYVDTGIYEIALITDAGTVTDQSYNQDAWEGIESYAMLHSKTYKYYRPLEMNTSAYLDAIYLAVEGGAEVIVLPIWLFEGAVYYAQQLYPNIQFILIDGTPHNDEYTIFETADNTASILFKEHEAGFLAGYAAVMDGHRNIAFAGGVAVPAVVRFGIGYIAGAYYAAEELGVEITFGNDNFIYFDAFYPSDETATIAANMYESGVEVIFAVAGGAGGSVMYAAQNADKVMIGADIDQSSQSDAVLTSAMKLFDNVVYQALDEYYNGTLTSGQTTIKGISDNAVGLPMETSRFHTFSNAQYEAIYELINNGTIVVPSSPDELAVFFNNTITGTKDYPDTDTIYNLD